MPKVRIKEYMIPIPVSIRKRFHINNGEQVEVSAWNDGKLVVRKIRQKVLSREKSVIERCFGIWANYKEIGNTEQYLRDMRKGWERRLSRLGVK